VNFHPFLLQAERSLIFLCNAPAIAVVMNINANRDVQLEVKSLMAYIFPENLPYPSA
jgi:hypothetical protein